MANEERIHPRRSSAKWKLIPLSILLLFAAFAQMNCLALADQSASTASTSFDLILFGSQFGDGSFERLPNTGRSWSILENQAPLTVAQPLDTGGLQTGTLPLFGALGASWTENEYSLNGFDITDPYLPGKPLIDLNLDALSQINIISGAKPASFGASGTNVDTITRKSSDTFHGSAQLFFSDQLLQSNNVDPVFINPGFTAPDRLNHMVDAAFHLTGRIPELNWPLFASVSTQQVNKAIGGFGDPIDGSEYSAVLTVTPVSNSRSRVDVLYAGQHLSDSHEGATAKVEPTATARSDDNAHALQTEWSYHKSTDSTLTVGFGFAHANLSSLPQADGFTRSTIDLPQDKVTGGAPLTQIAGQTRYEVHARFESATSHHFGSHAFNAGIHYDHSTMNIRWDAPAMIQQILVGGTGAEVIEWNTPAKTSARISRFAIYGEDSWEPLPHITIPLGLRLETSTGHGTNAAPSISWTSLQPRLGVLISTSKRGPKLVASWSRYAHLLEGRYFDFGNASALSGQVFRWNDANHNQQADPGEVTQLLSRFGGLYSSLDRNLKQPFTTEITAGLEQDFGHGWRAGVRFFRRDDRNMIGLINTGVPSSAYSPVPILDPGNDGIPGTPDDLGIITLFNRDPAFLGKDFFLLTNPPDRDGNSKGFQIAISRSFARQWEFAVSFTAMRTSGVTNPGNSVLQNDTGVIGNLGADPNTLLFAEGTTFFDRGYTGKLAAYYQAPSHFRVGIVARYYDGLPFGRLLFVSNFNQGPFFVRVTPRDDFPKGYRTLYNATLDVRVAREFTLRQNRFNVSLDVFNLLNMNNTTFENDLTGKDFRVPVFIQAPRMATLGFEWNF